MKQHTIWTVIVGLAFSGALSGTLPAADKKTDVAAEQQQIEKEDAEQQAERANGIMFKYQVVFDGTVYLFDQPSEEFSPDVVGYFKTSLTDRKPGRTYLMKLAPDSKSVAAALKNLNGKHAQLTGKLRVIAANGEAKYLIVDSVVVESGPTPKVRERRAAGGL